MEFLAPHFALTQLQQLQSFGEYTNTLRISESPFWHSAFRFKETRNPCVLIELFALFSKLYEIFKAKLKLCRIKAHSVFRHYNNLGMHILENRNIFPGLSAVDMKHLVQ